MIDDLEPEYWKLRAVVESLATGAGPLKVRLRNSTIALSTALTEADFGPDLLPKYRSIWAHLMDDESPARGEALEAAVNALDDATAKAIALKIVRLFCDVAELRAKQDPRD